MTNATAPTRNKAPQITRLQLLQKPVFFLLAALIGGLFISTPARSQEIPNEIVSAATTLNAEQQKAVETYAQPLLEGIKGDEATKVRDARVGLIKPLQRSVVGVPFRQAYSKVLGIPLTQLATGKRTLNAVNALRVAAELATTEGFDVIEKGFSSDDAAVRVAAAGAAGRAFSIASKATSIVVPKRLLDMTTALGKLVESDPNSDVVDGAADALVEAIRSSASTEVRNGAVAALCRGVSAQTQKVKSAVPDKRTLFAILRAGLALRDELTNANAGNRPALPAESIKAIGEVGGDMIASVARLVASGALPNAKAGDPQSVRREKEEERVMPAQIVGAGEQILSLIADRTEPIRTSLSEKIREGTVDSDAKFLLDVKQLLGPGGRLTRAPFNLPANRFDLDK